MRSIYKTHNFAIILLLLGTSSAYAGWREYVDGGLYRFNDNVLVKRGLTNIYTYICNKFTSEVTFYFRANTWEGRYFRSWMHEKRSFLPNSQAVEFIANEDSITVRAHFAGHSRVDQTEFETQLAKLLTSMDKEFGPLPLKTIANRLLQKKGPLGIIEDYLEDTDRKDSNELEVWPEHFLNNVSQERKEG